jgi:adenylate kinase family enzyme
VTLQRIIVIGTTGSGKTTMAGRLAERLGIPHVEQDALNWGPDWTMRPNEEFRALVDRATAGEAWVVDGNYSRSRDIVWPRADTVVWLDYALPIIMWRLWWRTLGRWFRQEELWSGNRESLRTHFASRDSLFLWALSTYGRRRREYPALLSAHENSHLTLVHLRTPRQSERWLAELQP